MQINTEMSNAIKIVLLGLLNTLKWRPNFSYPLGFDCVVPEARVTKNQG